MCELGFSRQLYRFPLPGGTDYKNEIAVFKITLGIRAGTVTNQEYSAQQGDKISHTQIERIKQRKATCLTTFVILTA